MDEHEDQHLHTTRAYYDEFAERYEDRRDRRDPGGYHDLLDELEVSFVERFGRDRHVLEVGCGTGLLLRRIAGFARGARGVDLSPGMLARARGRGLDVTEASATDLPFPDGSFDVACSFKVLAHVRDIHRALAEMARVVRPGGYVLAELYNPISLRGLVKQLGPAGAISAATDESAVYTRFDAPWRIGDLKPRGTELVASRGVRIVIPAAAALRVPGLGWALRNGERLLCDSPLRYFGGFWIAALRKEGSAVPSTRERLDELFARVDAFFARVRDRFPGGDGVTCHAGCDDCCRRRFSVTAIEAEVIAEHLAGLPEPIRAALAERAERGDAGVCPALEPDGRCAVYAARPVICRTHGLPIRFAAPSGPGVRALPIVDACPKNFAGRARGALPADSVLDQTTVSTVLGALDAARAAELGRPRGERVELAALLARA